MFVSFGYVTRHSSLLFCMQCLKVCKPALRIASCFCRQLLPVVVNQEYTTERVKLEAMRDKMVVDMEKKGINPKVGAQNIFSCSLATSF